MKISVYDPKLLRANRDNFKSSALNLGDLLNLIIAFGDKFKNVELGRDGNDHSSHEASTLKDASVDNKPSLVHDMEASDEGSDTSSDGSVTSSDEMAAAYVEMASLLNEMESDFDDEDSDSSDESSDFGEDDLFDANAPQFSLPAGDRLYWFEEYHPDGSLKYIMTEDAEFNIRYGFSFRLGAKIPEDYLIHILNIVRQHVVLAKAMFDFIYELSDIPRGPQIFEYEEHQEEYDANYRDSIPWLWTYYHRAIRAMTVTSYRRVIARCRYPGFSVDLNDSLANSGPGRLTKQYLQAFGAVANNLNQAELRFFCTMNNAEVQHQPGRLLQPQEIHNFFKDEARSLFRFKIIASYQWDEFVKIARETNTMVDREVDYPKLLWEDDMERFIGEAAKKDASRKNATRKNAAKNVAKRNAARRNATRRNATRKNATRKNASRKNAAKEKAKKAAREKKQCGPPRRQT